MLKVPIILSMGYINPTADALDFTEFIQAKDNVTNLFVVETGSPLNLSEINSVFISFYHLQHCIRCRHPGLAG